MCVYWGGGGGVVGGLVGYECVIMGGASEDPGVVCQKLS